MPVTSKNRGHPTRSTHSPSRSKRRAFWAYTSTIRVTALTTSGHRGGLLGRNGMASLENFGSLRALLTLPPTQTERPSFSGSFICIAAHTVKQLEQYMHCSSTTSTVRL